MKHLKLYAKDFQIFSRKKYEVSRLREMGIHEDEIERLMTPEEIEEFTEEMSAIKYNL